MNVTELPERFGSHIQKFDENLGLEVPIDGVTHNGEDGLKSATVVVLSIAYWSRGLSKETNLASIKEAVESYLCWVVAVATDSRRQEWACTFDEHVKRHSVEVRRI